MSRSSVRSVATDQSGICSKCHERPRLGALTRCVSCVRASAAVDRQSRDRAVVRVSAKAARQAAIEKLGEMYLEFAGSPEGVRFFEAQQAELLAPRNAPEYLKAVLANERDRETVANEVSIVHHVVDWGRNYVSLTLRDDRDHAKAREVSATLQRLFEAEHRYQEDPHDQSKAAGKPRKQPPKHEFGREKRTLRASR